MAAKKKKAKKKTRRGQPKRSLLDQRLDELERKLITASLKRHHGVLRQVSDELKVNRGGLYKRMTRLGIKLDDYREAA